MVPITIPNSVGLPRVWYREANALNLADFALTDEDKEVLQPRYRIENMFTPDHPDFVILPCLKQLADQEHSLFKVEVLMLNPAIQDYFELFDDYKRKLRAYFMENRFFDIHYLRGLLTPKNYVTIFNNPAGIGHFLHMVKYLPED